MSAQADHSVLDTAQSLPLEDEAAAEPALDDKPLVVLSVRVAFPHHLWICGDSSFLQTGL